MVAAPGRVNLIGEHIDYNDGFVLPMALDRYTVIAGRAIEGSQARVFAADLDQEVQVSLTDPINPPSDSPDWCDYIRGVVAGFQELASVPAFEMVVQSAVPLGSGLSSSAALEVATATFLEALTGVELTKHQKALLCQKAEHDYAKVPCGIMDQFSSVFGQDASLMLLDCQDQTLQQVPFNSDEVSVLIANTNVKHALTGGEYAERRGQCEEALRIIGSTSYRDVTEALLHEKQNQMSDVLFRRARHVVTEIQRTVDAAAAFRSADWERAGQLMYASHASLRDDFEVSCPELDAMVEAARQADSGLSIIGSRMTGGGFGGCTVTLVPQEQAARAAEVIGAAYEKATGIEPSIFVSRPSKGAHVVKNGGSLS